MSGRGRTAADTLITALAPMVWGSTYLVTTEFLPPDRPLLAALTRALPAGLILLLITRALPKGVWWWRALVLGTLNIGAFLYLLYIAAYLLPGGVAALVMAVQPVIVLLLGALVLRETIRPAHALACLLGALGVALLVVGPEAALNPVGVMAGLLGAVCMGSGIVLAKRWGRPEGVGVLATTGWQLTAGGLVLLLPTLLLEGCPPRSPWPIWAATSTSDCSARCSPTWCGSAASNDSPALAVSFMSFASPLTATLLGFLVLNETLTMTQGLGALAAVGAVLLVQLTAYRPPRRPASASESGEARPEPVVPGDEPVSGQYTRTTGG